MPQVQKRVTIRDIARAAKVSRATVSLALNNKGNLPESRRTQIKRLAEEMNYVPNGLAQALRGVRTRSVGVVTNYFSNIYFRDFYIGMEKVADAHGFSFMVSQAYETLEKERRQVAKFLEYGVDGLIVLPCSQEKEHLQTASEMGVPVVLISNTLGGDFAAVQADNIQGTMELVKHLFSFDPDRSVLHIAGSPQQSSQLQRRECFVSVIHKLHPDINPESLVYEAKGLRSQAGYDLMERILSEHTPPISIFVSNDEVASGISLYANEHNLLMPEDIAVACFSGNPTFGAVGPSISTAMVPAKRMGEMTARLLLELIESPEERDYPPIITLSVALHDNLTHSFSSRMNGTAYDYPLF